MIRVLVAAWMSLALNSVTFAQAKPAAPVTPAASAPEIKTKPDQARVLTGKVLSVDLQWLVIDLTLTVLLSSPVTSLSVCEVTYNITMLFFNDVIPPRNRRRFHRGLRYRNIPLITPSRSTDRYKSCGRCSIMAICGSHYFRRIATRGCQ